MYFILSCLIVSGHKKNQAHISYSKLMVLIMVSGGYGMILELIQPIVSDRASEFSDFLANFIGASFGAGLMNFYHKPK
jgi:VanZ family protein